MATQVVAEMRRISPTRVIESVLDISATRELWPHAHGACAYSRASRFKGAQLLDVGAGTAASSNLEPESGRSAFRHF